MKRLFVLSTIVLTFVLYAIYSAGAVLGNVPTTSPAVVVAVLTVTHSAEGAIFFVCCKLNILLLQSTSSKLPGPKDL
jgi:hypothetical protein